MMKRRIILTEKQVAEVFGKNAILETSRRQKAVQAMNGNDVIKTMAILTSENPRYSDVMDPNDKDENGNPRKNYGEKNNDRRTDLEKTLKTGHFAWFPVKGQYFGKENSYIIYNISLEDTLYLGKKYGQESVIWIDGTKCQYWEQSGDGNYTMTHERDMSQRLDMSDADDLFTQISRAFKFQIPFFDGSDENKEELEKMNEYVNKVVKGRILNESEISRRIDTCLNAKSGANRYANHSELYGNNFQW